MSSVTGTTPVSDRLASGATSMRVLSAISICHFLNDLMQSLLPALYPILKTALRLDFGQIGLITLTFQCTASLLQPVVGFYTDRKPKPFSLATAMCATFCGLLMLAAADSYTMLLVAAAAVGLGSAVFHPESSRVARLASGGRHGFAQSLFQVGGNTGSAAGPLLTALIVQPYGQASVAWFALAALTAIAILFRVGRWYQRNAGTRLAISGHGRSGTTAAAPRKQVAAAFSILIVLVFSKYVYLASLTSYYTFYLIHKFGIGVRSAQIHLFVFLGAAALGTFAGGPAGDRWGRKTVIWVSILGVLPFSLLLPHVNLFWTGVLSVFIGLIIASAFSAILVYAQELMPGRVGLVSGLFFGLAFGMAGIGAAVLGQVADHRGIDFVYRVCAFLPALGLLTALLPNHHPATAEP